MYKVLRATLIGYYKRTGGHFFSDHSMDIFNCVVHPDVWQIGKQGKDEKVEYVFVTSERYSLEDEERWTVRYWNGESQCIDNVGGFRAYERLEYAVEAAIAHATGLDAMRAAQAHARR